MLIVICPHCQEQIIIERKEINCGIFRHGVYKSNHKQINPHLCQEKCEELIKTRKIHGCGKPFKLENEKAIVCDYI